jgi:hypothetical protein
VPAKKKVSPKKTQPKAGRPIAKACTRLPAKKRPTKK